jgi:pimeloyl-ACP methyl ester carboxylesterase
VGDVTVLLLHAFPVDARMWDAQRAVLEEAGYRVEVPDLPGEPPEVGLDAWARRLLPSLAGDLVPVGCSMGGYLAFELWRQERDRIRALVLADSRATADSPEQQQARDDTIRLLGEAGKPAFWEGLGPKLFSAGVDPDLVEQTRTVVLEQPITGLVTVLETLRDRPDSRSTLAEIDVPVLVLVGEADELTPPADSEAMVAALRDAQFLTIAGAGHLSPLERPAEVGRAVLGFLEGVVR